MSPRAKRLLLISAYAAVVGAVLYFRRDVLHQLTGLGAGGLALIVAGQCWLLYCNSALNRLLYRAAGFPLRFSEALYFLANGSLGEQLVPGAGLLFRLSYLRLKHGVTVAQNLGLLAVSALANLLCLFTLSAATLALTGIAPPWASAALAAGTAVALALLPFALRRISARWERFRPLASMRPSFLPVLLLACCVNQLSYSALLGLVLGLLGHAVAPLGALELGLAGTLVGSIGIFPAGLGALELSMTVLSGRHHLGAGEIVLAGLLIRAGGIMAALLQLGGFAAARLLRARRA